MFDLFSGRDEEDDGDRRGGVLVSGQPGAGGTNLVGGGTDNSDDAEGYYRLRVGELLAGRYQVLGTRGRGVFSTVLYCRDVKAVEASGAAASSSSSSASSSSAAAPVDDEATILEVAAAGGELATSAAPLAVGSSGALVKQHAALATGSQTHVAVKVIRANDLMRKACAKEVDILRALATADPGGRYHCVRLLHTFEHAGHVCLVFESLAMNLKEVQDKFGTGVGLSVRAVREFARQLLLALGLLHKLRIIHADIKPHNILAAESYRTIKLADFGSALREDDEADTEPTPYVVSRFYRAPEVVLGCRLSPALDIWSAACVLFELYTGAPLFPGRDNNDMLFRMQQVVGRFPNRLVRRHLQHAAATGAEPHFEGSGAGDGAGGGSVADVTLRFRRRTTDPVTGAPGSRLLDFTFVKAQDEVHRRLSAARDEGDDKRALKEMGELLLLMLHPDPLKRITVKDALKHAFVTRKG